MKTLISLIKSLVVNTFNDNVPAYAAQVSFFMVISALPLFTMLIPLLRYIIPISEASVINAVLSFMPNSPELHNFITSITQDVYTNSTGTIISISVLSTLWAASKGIYSLQVGLNSVAEVKETRLYIVRRVFAIGYTIGFVFVLLFSISIMLFGNKIQLLFEYFFPILAHFDTLIRAFRNGLSFTLFMLFFVIIYTMLPNQRFRFWRQIPGAACAAIGWMIFSQFYSIYIEQIGRFSYLYGSLAALILLMLWLYACMYIVLIGAEINKMIDQHLTMLHEKKRIKKAGFDTGLEDDPE